MNQAKHFSVIDFIVALFFAHRLRAIHNWMPKVIFMSLCKDSSCSKTRRVNFNSCRECRVIDLKYWLLTELCFKCVEHMLLLRMPLPGHIFLGEVRKGMCNACKVLY